MLVAAVPAAAAGGAAMVRLIWPPRSAEETGAAGACVVVIEEGTQGCSVLLDGPAPAPPGWKSDHGGTVWSRPSPAGAVPAAASLGCRAPLLIGTSERGEVSVDMATLGVLCLEGHGPAVTDFLACLQQRAADSQPRLAVVSGDDTKVVALLRAEGAPVVVTGRRALPGEWQLLFDTTDEAVLQPLGLTVRIERPAPAAPGVLVRVLGPVTVEGATDAARAKVVELIVFVALHPGTSDERIKAALWPERIPSPGTFHNSVSAARSCLGTGPGGPRFPPSEASRYRLSDEVEVDWVRLEEAGASGDRTALRGTLGLVRGMPFEAKGGYEWAHEEGLTHAASAEVLRATRSFIAMAADAGDGEAVAWAARRGLSCCPGEPALLEVLGRRASSDNSPPAHGR